MSGVGVKTWSGGKVYQGEFFEGEMHGQGTLTYNDTSYRQKDARYEG